MPDGWSGTIFDVRTESPQLCAADPVKLRSYADNSVELAEEMEPLATSLSDAIASGGVVGPPDLEIRLSDVLAELQRVTAGWVTLDSFAGDVADAFVAADGRDDLQAGDVVAGFTASDLRAAGSIGHASEPDVAELMGPERAAEILLAEFDEVDVAAGIGDEDGTIGRQDLEAIVDSGDFSDEVTEAARYLLETSPEALEALMTISGESRHLTRDDVDEWLAAREAWRTLALDFRSFDVAREMGDGEFDAEHDGWVSAEDLAAVAEGRTLAPPSAQEAAAFVLEYFDGFDGVSQEEVNQIAVEHQVFVDHPEQAHAFVLTLPVAGPDGDGAQSIDQFSDESVQQLANASLLFVGDDLTDRHEVITHLPETNSGVRNELITAMYVEMSTRMDTIVNGPLAGRPDLEGHAGANWTHFGVWASETAGQGIRADLSVFGFSPTGGGRDALAAGNQAIFSQTAQFASFIELYEENPEPGAAELQAFFDDNFSDGDGTLQDAFVLYVGAMQTTDPLARQELMYQANVLVGFQEQTYVHEYYQDLIPVPLPIGETMAEETMTDYMNLEVGDFPVPLGEDVPPISSESETNLVADVPFLDLDPNAAVERIAPEGVITVSAGEQSAEGTVTLDDMAGIEAFQPDFNQSFEDIHANGAFVTEYEGLDPSGLPRTSDVTVDNPDSLEGTGAENWLDWDQRMLFIAHLFRESHNDEVLFSPQDFDHAHSFSELDWLHPDAQN